MFILELPRKTLLRVMMSLMLMSLLCLKLSLEKVKNVLVYHALFVLCQHIYLLTVNNLCHMSRGPIVQHSYSCATGVLVHTTMGNAKSFATIAKRQAMCKQCASLICISCSQKFQVFQVH